MKLNLGSGSKTRDGYINIDIDESAQPDLILDISTGLPYSDNSVDEIIAYDFLEHIKPDKVIFVINEIWRVLKPGGRFEHLTPSTDGRGAFQDPTHVSFWNINSWLYFCDSTECGKYGIKSRFKIEVLQDGITSDQFNIVHTRGILFKPEQT
jgi:SAM-dependent methyltransferase